MLEAFCVVGNAKQCARELTRRFNGLLDLICGYTSGTPGLPREILAEIRSAG
jgi:hypothetical protein